MRRRDSRNEVFLSALDLFSLLLFTFMRIALAARSGAAANANLVLPALEGSSKPGPPGHGLYLAWQKREGSQCFVTASVDSPSADPISHEVDCLPAAFFGGESHLNPELARLGSEIHKAIILCPTDGAAALESCARLQWVVAAHGFAVSAAVSIR